MMLFKLNKVFLAFVLWQGYQNFLNNCIYYMKHATALLSNHKIIGLEGQRVYSLLSAVKYSEKAFN